MTSPDAHGDSSTSRFPLALISIFVFVLTMMTFVNAVNADFVNWDDDAYVTENPLVQSLSLASIAKIFSSAHFYAWVPLTLLSHAVDVALWGMNPKGHHLSNIVLHSCNAVLLLYACLLLFRFRNARNATGLSGEPTSILVGSMVASMLFAMHPLRVESVAWISGRKDLLCAFFLLSSFYSYILWKLRSHRWLLSVSVIMFACAILSKPTAIPFPVVLLLVDSWLSKEDHQTSSIAHLLKDKIPYFLLSVIGGAATLIAAGGGNVNVVAELSLLERLLLPPYMFVFYLWRTIVPVNLSPVYPELNSFMLALAPIAAVGVLWVVWIFLKRRQGAIPLAIISYVLFLLPVIFGLSSGLQPIADRYSYISLLSIFILIAGTIELLWRTSAASGAKKYRRRVLFALLMLIWAVSCYRTIRHVAVWNNSVSLWTQASRYVPATRAQYEQRHPYMRPNHLDALVNLGTAYHAEGDKDRAIEQFRRILVLDERSSDAHYNIGNVLFEKGDVEGSIASFKEALASDSLYAKAYYNLGIIFANRGESERALSSLQRAARLGFVDAQRLLQQQGIGW